MEDAITNLTSMTIDLQFIWHVVQGAVAFFISLSLKNWVTRYAAWWRFKSSVEVGIGTWLRLPLVDGSVDGKITRAGMDTIIIESSDVKVCIPTKTFEDRDWYILKRDSHGNS